MLLGYNTNGFAFHRFDDVLEIIADLGYRCVAITVDHHVLNPYDSEWKQQVKRTRDRLAATGLDSVIETGARFLLNPRRKHHPTLLDPTADGRERRFSFLSRCVDIAEGLESSAVSFWSGTLPAGQRADAALELLADSCRRLADYAADRGVTLAFEPEPGMLVDRLAGYRDLAAAVDRPNFRLTIDIGHLQCNENRAPDSLIRLYADELANVHLDDMRRGVHDHLFFGEGEVDLAAIFGAFREIGYTGPACVELSRHSHNAVVVATEARHILEEYL